MLVPLILDLEMMSGVHTKHQKDIGIITITRLEVVLNCLVESKFKTHSRPVCWLCHAHYKVPEFYLSANVLCG